MSAAAKVLWAARDLPIPKSRTEQGRSALTLCVSAPNLHLVQLSLWLSGMGKGFRLALAAYLCSVRKTTPEQGHIVTLRNHPGCWHWENIPMSRTGFCPGDIRVLKGHSHPFQCSAQEQQPQLGLCIAGLCPHPMENPTRRPNSTQTPNSYLQLFQFCFLRGGGSGKHTGSVICSPWQAVWVEAHR